MRNFAQSSHEDRRPFFEEAQTRIGLVAPSIEKDFWVCWTLQELFGLPGWDNRLTFKGGTSLSKAWGLISRFSEDIDVVINRESLGFGGETLGSKRQKNLRKRCSACIQNELHPALEKRFTALLQEGTWKLLIADETEDPDRQTLLFHYSSAFGDSTVGYVRPVVKIEFDARSETEPVNLPSIEPYLVKVFPDLLKGAIFSIPTVAARRTFWEKAMLLHEEMYRPRNKIRKVGLSRHYYDLWCLINAGIHEEALNDKGLFDRIARHRQALFRQTWLDYDTLRKGSLRLTPTDEQMEEWHRDYNEMRVMFFVEPPSFEEILQTVKEFERRFNEA